MLTMPEPHTHLALNLLQREYLNHFDFIVILCPTLQYNATYHRQKWFNIDPYIIQIELGLLSIRLHKRIGNLLAGSKTLFLIDDIIADETLNK